MKPPSQLRGGDPSYVEFLERLIEILLPQGGFVMSMYEAYFDESGCDDYSRVLAIGGYVIRSDLAKRLDQKWKNVLVEYGLPYFHMVDCAHGNGVFSNLSKEQRVSAETKFIKLIKEYTAFGVACIIPVKRFEQDSNLPDPYSFCIDSCGSGLQGLLPLISSEAERKVAVIFEAGHQNENRAITHLKRHIKPGSVIRSVTAMSKTDARPLQAADLLA
jgi:hypothetical protein